MSEFEDFLRGLLRNVKQTLASSRELIALVLPLVCKKSVESANGSHAHANSEPNGYQMLPNGLSDGSRAHSHSEATKYGNAIATSSFVSTLTIETPRSRTKPPLFGVRSKNTSYCGLKRECREALPWRKPQWRCCTASEECFP